MKLSELTPRVVRPLGDDEEESKLTKPKQKRKVYYYPAKQKAWKEKNRERVRKHNRDYQARQRAKK